MWGDASPVRTEADVIERRGGRVIPNVESSRSDFQRLLALSNAMAAQATTLLHLGRLEFPMPTPTHLARVTFDTEQGCWILPYSPSGPRRRDTYGRLKLPALPSPSGLAHRTLYQVYFGADSLPNGRHDFLDHICENKPCCYPRHLDKVTQAENNRRGRVVNHGIEPFNFDI